MVDVDGVVIVQPEVAGWATHLERDLGLSGERLQEVFFERHWQDVVLGRAVLRERLAPVLAEIAPHLSPERLMGYWFANDAHLDDELLAQLALVRAAGVKLHLATVQEHERARYIWEGLGLRSRFDGMHYAAELGCAKPDAQFFQLVERRTGFSSGEIAFIDDKQVNIDAARKRGWSAALWDGTQPLAAVMAGMGQ